MTQDRKESFVKLEVLLNRHAAILCALLMLPVACSGDDQQAAQPAAQPETPAQPAQAPSAAHADGTMVTGPADAPYRIKCGGIDPDSGEKLCLVDKATYIGWRTFHSTCFVCHGPNALGSTFAPSLVERLKEIDKARFMNSVQNGFQGQIGVMPAWKDNPNINKHFDDLYNYLRARSDGALPAVRPQRLMDD
jgi:Cytochrome C oxidase, cbb3-type, subunit III